MEEKKDNNFSVDTDELKNETKETVNQVKDTIKNVKIKEDSVINACSVFGGIEILVPKDVKVKVKSTSIFGGVSEKNKNTAPDKASIIYVNAVCIFGGVTIYYKD